MTTYTKTCTHPYHLHLCLVPWFRSKYCTKMQEWGYVCLGVNSFPPFSLCDILSFPLVPLILCQKPSSIKKQFAAKVLDGEKSQSTPCTYLQGLDFADCHYAVRAAPGCNNVPHPILLPLYSCQFQKNGVIQCLQVSELHSLLQSCAEKQ